MGPRKSGGSRILILSMAIVPALTVARAMGGVPNDYCAQADAITGEGMFAFDNSLATTDGPSHGSCSSDHGPEIVRDVWYCWTASCDGAVTVDTCQGTTVDTKLAVYAGCDCPPSDANLLACNDDECVYQSSVAFEATAGQSYLIRVGVHPYLGGGADVFTITCGQPLEPACSLSSENCQNRDGWNAFNSNRTDFAVADDFTPESDGIITELCWWGTYFDGLAECRVEGADTFEVRYYSDEAGLPGALLAGPFSQADGTLAVAGPARTGGMVMDLLREYEYAAAHDPVAVTAGQCYWIEISNSASDSCAWYWEAGAPASRWALQTDAFEPPVYVVTDAIPDDLAFCLNIVQGDSTPCLAPPVNDDCANSLPIYDGQTSFDTTGATTDGSDEPACEFTFADPEVNQDIWFDYVAPPPCNGIVTVTLCDTMYDAKMAVYEGSECIPAGEPIACNDDACGGDWALGSQVSFPVTIGQNYKLRIGGFGDAAGLGTIAIALDLPDCNDNGIADECDILDGTSIDCDLSGVPDECETDCNENGIHDKCDLDAKTSDDCNLNGVPDECDRDCNENDIPDDCDIATGSSLDENVNGVPDECECLLSKATKLGASEVTGDDFFGVSVFISGEVAVIGASRADDLDGAAYVYRFDGMTWVEEAKITASDPMAPHYFGASVSISGHAALIGASSIGGWGRAYVYRFNGTGWGDEVALIPPDEAGPEHFGASVHIVGEVALVGAPRSSNESGIGAAYVYRFDGIDWIEEARLTPYIGLGGGQFGVSVSLSGDVALIGADASFRNHPTPGSVYVYRFDGSDWIEEAMLGAPDAAEGDRFGASVSLEGNVAVVGAPQHFLSGPTPPGSAYVYRFDGENWIMEARLTAVDGMDNDGFGNSVSISGDKVVIGATNDEDAGIRSGSAYVYRFDGANWIEEVKLIASDAESEDSFGISVSISDDQALIGAYRGRDDVGSRSGSAYVFGQPSDCNENGVPDGCELGDFDGDGQVDLTDFAQWGACMIGPGIGPVTGCCGQFDFDEDLDVDHRDFADFQAAFGG